MRRIMVSLLACASLSGMAGLTADEKKSEASDRTQVTTFLKSHVMGKTLVSPKTTAKRDEGRMERDYEDQTTFHNFVETAQGFRFDTTTVSKETRYELGPDGKRHGPSRDLSGTEVYRYEIVERVSTKKLTGTACLLSMTTKAPSREGAAMLVLDIKVKDGKLSWSETLPGYLDLIAANGKYKPGSWDSRSTFSLAKEKLRIEYDVTNFDVDPETLKRTPTKEKIPTSVVTETEEKSGK